MAAADTVDEKQILSNLSNVQISGNMKDLSKSILEKKKKEAFDLRQKLEIWKEEKKKKLNVEQRKSVCAASVKKPVQENIAVVHLTKKSVTAQVNPVMEKPLQNKAVHKKQTSDAAQKKPPLGKKRLSQKNSTSFKSADKENSKMPGGKKIKSVVSESLVNKSTARTSTVSHSDTHLLSRRTESRRRAATYAPVSEKSETKSNIDDQQKASKTAVDVATKAFYREVTRGDNHVEEKKSKDESESAGKGPQCSSGELTEMAAKCLLKEEALGFTQENPDTKIRCAADVRTAEVHILDPVAGTNHPSRDSLTAKFRKFKRLSLSNSAKRKATFLSCKDAQRRLSSTPSICSSRKSSQSTDATKKGISQSVAASKKGISQSIAASKNGISKSIAPPKKRISMPAKAVSSKPHRSILKLRHSEVLPPDSVSLPASSAACALSLVNAASPPAFAQIKTCMTPAGRVKFVTPSGTKCPGQIRYRKTPGATRAEEDLSICDRLKLNEWLAAKRRTPSSFRHFTCLGCHGDGSQRLEQTPRSQISRSVSREQIAKQENVLTREDSQPPCASCFHSPLPRRTSTPRPSGAVATATARHNEADVERTFVVGAEANVAEVPNKDKTTVSCTSQVESDFIRCVESIQKGALSPEDALEWLRLVSEAWPEVKHCSSFYRCQVAALQRAGDQDALLDTFGQAIVCCAQPAQDIAQLLKETMKELLPTQPARKRSHKATVQTPVSCRRVHSELACAMRRDVDEGNIFRSTAVKYSVVEVTPFKKRRRLTATSDADNAVIPVVTPVRRSTRISTSHAVTPKSTALKGTPYAVMEFSALEDVPSPENKKMLFQPNQALAPLLGDASPCLDNVSAILSSPVAADSLQELVPKVNE